MEPFDDQNPCQINDKLLCQIRGMGNVFIHTEYSKIW